MRFAELLTEYIGDRTLDEVSYRCAGQGHKVDSSYLSRLRSGSRPAPDDEGIVKALAVACERDPEPLIWLAKIERHPQEVFMLMRQHQYEAVCVMAESERVHIETSMRISEIVESKGTMDQVDAALLENSAKIRELIPVRMEMLKRHGKLLSLVNASPGPITEHAQALFSTATKAVYRSEDALIEVLAEVADVSPAALRELVATLKTVTTNIRREQEQRLAAKQSAGAAPVEHKERDVL